MLVKECRCGAVRQRGAIWGGAGLAGRTAHRLSPLEASSASSSNIHAGFINVGRSSRLRFSQATRVNTVSTVGSNGSVAVVPTEWRRPRSGAACSSQQQLMQRTGARCTSSATRRIIIVPLFTWRAGGCGGDIAEGRRCCPI